MFFCGPFVYGEPTLMLMYRYHDEPYPEFSGPTKINDHLENGLKLFENEILGPEGFAIDSNGTVSYC